MLCLTTHLSLILPCGYVDGGGIAELWARQRAWVTVWQGFWASLLFLSFGFLFWYRCQYFL